MLVLFLNQKKIKEKKIQTNIPQFTEVQVQEAVSKQKKGKGTLVSFLYQNKNKIK